MVGMHKAKTTHKKRMLSVNKHLKTFLSPANVLITVPRPGTQAILTDICHS